MLDVRLHVGGAPDPQPTDDRPMPEGCWRSCAVCRGLGEAVRYRTLFVLDGGWRVTEAVGKGVCGACGGRRYVRL